MALVLKDRVKETTSTTGTGTYTLAGAVSGFEAFSEIGNGNTTYYACTDGTDFEVGIGTYTASGTTLARTTILQSSNSDNAVSWSSGTRTIFCTQPAEKALFLDGDDVGRTETIELAGGATYDPPGSAGSSTATDVAIALLSGKRIVMGYNGYIRTILDAEWGQPMEIGQSGTSAFAGTKIYGGAVGVKLHYDSTEKFETTSGGINVTGTVTDDGATHDGDVTFTGASYNVLWDKSDNALELADNALIKVGAGDDMTISSDGTYPRFKANNIIFESNDADQGIYFRSNDTGDIADYDTGTVIYFQQYNDNNEQTTYNRLLSVPIDVTDGSEDGRFQFQSLKNGTTTTTFIIDPYYVYLFSDQTLAWYQYGGSYTTNLYPLTPTAHRYIRLPDRDGVIRVVDRNVITSNLAVGWHTIAVFQGRDDSGTGNQRFHAKFTLLEYTSSRHQAFTFYAQHMFGQDDGLQVIGNSTFGTDVVTAIRIKSSTDTNKTYAGAAIQVYVADATNNLILYLDEADFDGDEAGSSFGNVILKTGVADASDPGDVGYASASYSTFASSVNVGIDSIEPGGIGVTGNLLTQSNIVLEGATADAHETIITATDATADRTITLPDATGQVVLSDGAIDTDSSAEIGRAHIGNMGFNDYAGFSHVDSNGTGTYALLQHTQGYTYLNAATNADIFFRINNTNIMSMDEVGLHFNAGKVITFEGTTADDHETTLTAGEPTADRTITLPDATGEVVLKDSSDTVTISSTANDGPILVLKSDDPGDVADFNTEGAIKFFAENSASESIEYANIRMLTGDVTDGTEDGWIYFTTRQNAAFNNTAAFSGTSLYMLDDSSQLVFFGWGGTSYNVTLTPSTPSASRTITLPDATGTVALTSDIPSSGISSGNVATFTSGAADNDFLRIDGTAIEGRSASEVLSDIAAMPLAGGTFTGDVTLTGDNYNIVFDKSDDALEFADNAKAVFGTGGDLEIYHDGTHSYIQDTGTGNIRLPTSRLQIRNAANNATMINAVDGGKVALFHNGNEKLETTSGGITVTGEVAATSLDISGDVDVDGTLEADAITLNGTTITTTATLSTGISNGNVPVFTSGVADDDFLRVNGTSIEGRSASELASDIGAATTDDATALAIALG